MNVGGVDDAVGVGGRGRENVKVFGAALDDADPNPLQGGGGLARAGEADNLVPVGEQVLDDEGARRTR